MQDLNVYFLKKEDQYEDSVIYIYKPVYDILFV